ncbi:1,2-phenylacetyl-CoA epoxidase subunit PaaD [Flavitalea sp.]|nr:1,2-phenylacetyl-CoA epoxidase subunit PaaD [Flavitalea sp.]
MSDDINRIWNLLAQINDPELPVLSIVDLAIVRDVKEVEGSFEIIITPTYSGCPAMDVIAMEIRAVLLTNGIGDFKLTTVFSPAWTTDWMSEEGKLKLKSYGIAPPTPGQSVCDSRMFHLEEAIQCPLCNSYNTRMISQFGSTACKSLYQCNDCKEPFDYFKCH